MGLSNPQRFRNAAATPQLACPLWVMRICVSLSAVGRFSCVPLCNSSSQNKVGLKWRGRAKNAGGGDLGVLSRGKLTGTLPPLGAFPLAWLLGGPSHYVKLWFRVQSGRGRDIFPTEQSPSLSVCPSGGEVRREWRWQWKEQDRQAGALQQPPSCLEVDCSISISFACTGGVDSDQPEYQRCEAGMTSPRVCLLPEPCQATLPARSQHPPPPPG